MEVNIKRAGTNNEDNHMNGTLWQREMFMVFSFGGFERQPARIELQKKTNPFE